MNGTPVWLASISHRDKLTSEFTEAEKNRARELLRWMLHGVGDEKRQRLFRMCVTTCMHRALTPDEERALPESFHCAEAIDLAGGPLEILEETEPGRPSTRPCAHPAMVPLSAIVGARIRHSTAEFPMDCGACEPCLARAACHD